MKKIIHCILAVTLCAVMTASVFFQTGAAAENKPSDSVVTGVSTAETEPPESQEETSNSENPDATGSSDSNSSEPDIKVDGF